MHNDLPWFEQIRRRIGMYVGPPDHTAVCRLIWEAIDEAVDTAIDESCSRISVTIHTDCSVTIAYDGTYPETRAPDIQTAMTNMATQFEWRLAPIPIMNALSEHLTISIFTGTHHFQQHFRGGQSISSVEDHGTTTMRGRRIHFAPDSTCFSDVQELSPYAILGHLRTVAILAPNVRMQFCDERTDLLSELTYREGIRSYLIEQDYDQNINPQPLFYCSKADAHIAAKVAFHWCNRGLTHISSYANWRATPEGGSHVTGFWRGLAFSLDQFARQEGYFQADTPRLRRRHVPQPLTAIIAVRVETPKYRDASRNILHDSSVKAFVSQMLQEQLPNQFAANPHFVIEWAQQHVRFLRNKDI